MIKVELSDKTCASHHRAFKTWSPLTAQPPFSWCQLIDETYCAAILHVFIFYLDWAPYTRLELSTLLLCTTVCSFHTREEHALQIHTCGLSERGLPGSNQTSARVLEAAQPFIKGPTFIGTANKFKPGGFFLLFMGKVTKHSWMPFS